MDYYGQACSPSLPLPLTSVHPHVLPASNTDCNVYADGLADSLENRCYYLLPPIFLCSAEVVTWPGRRRRAAVASGRRSQQPVGVLAAAAAAAAVGGS